MTWDRLKDHYLLKFRSTYTRNPVVFPPELTWTLNFSRIILSIPITKKNVLSVACQFYNPTGLAASLMFFIRALFSKLCRDFCPRNAPTGSDAQSERSYSPKKYLFLARSYSTTQLSFISSLMVAFKDMGRVFMLALMINSTFSTAQQRYWARLHSLLRSLR